MKAIFNTGDIVYENGDDSMLYHICCKQLHKDNYYVLREIGNWNKQIYVHKDELRYVCSEIHNSRTNISNVQKLMIDDFATDNPLPLLFPLLKAYCEYSTHSMNDSAIELVGEKNMLGSIIKMLLNNVSNGMYGVLPCLAQEFYDADKALLKAQEEK